MMTILLEKETTMINHQSLILRLLLMLIEMEILSKEVLPWVKIEVRSRVMKIMIIKGQIIKMDLFIQKFWNIKKINKQEEYQIQKRQYRRH